MKKVRKILAVVLCCVLVIGLSTMASASVSKKFFTTTVGSKEVTGSGSLNTDKASVTLNATAISGKPQLVDSAYYSFVRVAAMNQSGKVLSASEIGGDVYAHTEIKYLSTASYYQYEYEFENTNLGSYKVNASLA